MKKQLFKKFLSAFLAAALMFTMLPGELLEAKADGAQTTLYIDDGTIDLSGNSATQGTHHYTNSAGFIVSQRSSTAVNYAIEISGGTVNLTLDNVKMDLSTSASTALLVETGGTTLNLSMKMGTHSYLTGGQYSAGIEVQKDSTLNILGDSGGILSCTGNNDAAGIGNSTLNLHDPDFTDDGVGTINIKDGIIYALGGTAGGAGIGSGGDDPCGDISISGGHVYATGGDDAAGIGGASEETCDGTIAISGGYIEANDNSGGEAIGWGNNDCTMHGTLNITGGTLVCGGDRIQCLKTYISGGNVQGNYDNAKVSASDSRIVSNVKCTVPDKDATKRITSLAVRLNGAPFSYGKNDMSSIGNVVYIALPIGNPSVDVGFNTGDTLANYYSKTGSAILKLDQPAVTVGGLLDNYTVPASISPTVSGGAAGSTVTKSYSGRDGTSYNSSPTAPTAVGKYTFTASVPENDIYYGTTATKDFEIDPNTSTLQIAAIADQPYTGSAITPELTVKANGTPLTSSDYTVSFSNNTAVGTATVVVTGTGSYTGYTASATFKIVSGLQSITVGKKAIAVGQSANLTATGNYSDGSTRDLTSSVTWNSSNDSVAAVDGGGKVTALKEGTATITATAKDGSGIFGSAAVTVAGKPTISVTDDHSGWAASVPLTVATTTYDSNASAHVAVSFSADGNTFGSSQPVTGGSYTANENGTYRFTVTDGLSQTASQDVPVSRIDSTTPNTPTITNAGNYVSSKWYNTPQTVAATFATTGGCAEHLQYSFNGQDWVDGTSAAVSVEGTTNVSFRVIDALDRAGNTVSVPVNIDTAKPVVQINSNGYTDGTWTKNNVMLNVSNSTQNLGTTAFEYSTDGLNWSSVTGGSITDSAEGSTTYQFRAKSASGVVSNDQSITVKIDKTAPTGMLISFKQNPFKTVAHFATFGLFFGNTVDVNFSANDQGGSGIDHYQYQTVAEGGTFDENGTWQTGSLSISPEYKGTIYARAVDKVGHVSGYVAKALVVDKTAPVITAQTSLITNDPNASIPGEIKDNGAGVGTVTYQVNGGLAQTVDLTSNAYSDLTKDYSLSIGTLPDGVYDVTVNAQDNSGNIAATATVHVVKNAAQAGFTFTSGTLSKTWGDAPFTVTAAGGQSGGAITYAVTGGTDILSVDSITGKATIRKAGIAVITATKAAGSGYSAATAQMTVNVSKATPVVQTPPSASGISVIGKLSASNLTGGNASVPGTFIWANPDMVVTKTGSYAVSFTPTDSSNYNAVGCNIPVVVTPILTDGSSNPQLDFTGVALPEGVASVSLESYIQGSSSSSCSVMEKLIGQDKSLGNLNSLTVYDLKLLDQNGNPVTNFTGKIKVKIPIPAGMSGNLKVLWYNPADGTLTDMNAVQENGYLVFETSHFSFYAIAQLGSTPPAAFSPVQNPKTGSSNWPLFPLAVLGGGAAIGAVIIKRRRFFKIKKRA